MCGIAGFHVLGNAPAQSQLRLERLADELLLGIDERGGDATGYVACTYSGETQLQRASCRAFAFAKERRAFPAKTRTVLLHTRLATQGSAAFPENNHPLYSGSVYAVHNGHVWNDRELYAPLRKQGIARLGSVDSEVIPALVRSTGWESLPHSLEPLEGAYAVAILETKSGNLCLARGYSSPLVYVKTDNLLVWASTRYAIEGAWKRSLGTIPRTDRFTYLLEGESLLVRGSQLETRRFSPYAPVPVKTSWSHWKKLGSELLDESRLLQRLSLPSLEEETELRVERSALWDDYDNCAECQSPTPVWNLVRDSAGDDYCYGCAEDLEEEGRIRVTSL